MKKGALTTVRFLPLIALIASVLPFDTWAFTPPMSRFNLDIGGVWTLQEGGVSVTNSVSASANTGGNSASGREGSSGGTITTGDARASASVETTVGGEEVENVRIDIETEGDTVEIERSVATSSGNVEVETEVHVSASGATSSTTKAGSWGEQRSDLEEFFDSAQGREFDGELKELEEIGDELHDNLDSLEEDVEEIESRPIIVRWVRKVFKYVFSILGF